MLVLKKMSFAPAHIMNKGREKSSCRPEEVEEEEEDEDEESFVFWGEMPARNEASWSVTAGTGMVEPGPVKPWIRALDVVAPPTA